MNFAKAMLSAQKAANDVNPTQFNVGDKVTILNHDFYNESATVSGHETNLFGLPLIVVEFGDRDGDTVFYPHELKHQHVG